MIVLDAVETHQVLYQLVIDFKLLLAGLLRDFSFLAECDVFAEQILSVVVIEELPALLEKIEGLSAGDVTVPY